MQSFLNGYMIPTPLAFGRNVKGAHLQLAALVQPALSWAVACAAEPQGWLLWSHHHWNLKIGQCIQTQSVCSMLQVEFLKQKTFCKLPLWDSSYYIIALFVQLPHKLSMVSWPCQRICAASAQTSGLTRQLPAVPSYLAAVLLHLGWRTADVLPCPYISYTSVVSRK